MSLLGTLAKVAIGIAVAKGVGGMMKRGRTGADDGILGGEEPLPKSGGGLGDIMGDILSGGAGNKTGGKPAGGGLGDLLEQLGGGSRGKSGGGFGDILGQLGGQQTRGGDDKLGDIFGEFLGGAKNRQSNDSFGDIFNESLQQGGEPKREPSRDQEAVAALMLRAMIQAAKSDGKLDAAERKKLLENLGDVSREEEAFVNAEFARPVDVSALANQVPQGLEEQVYLMSIMGIDLDNRKEAEYLHELATEFDMDRRSVNAIHDQLGVPRLYS